MVIVSDVMLREFVTEILKAAETPEEEAAWVADCLVLSNVKGVDSHGVQQIPGYVRSIQDGRLKPGAELTLLKEKAATALFDGGGGFGYTMAREAMRITLKKAKEAGVAYSGVRNLHHIGRVGRWAEMALEEEMIGIASQPGGVYVAPWGGIDRKLPIAPIAVAVPAGRHKPIVVDMSLGPIAGGRNSILALRGMRLPQGWMVDGDGNPADDPAMFQRGEGAQLPLGQAGLGYKGMALNMIIDIFSGPLLGFLGTAGPPFQRRGVFLGAIDVEAFTPLDEFKEGADAIIEDLKSSRLASGFTEITVPGEPEWREQERRLREGVYLDDEIYERILDTAEKVGVDTTKYRGKPGRLEITHPSYTLKDRYD
jgi:LDH2 family malate/lactate/ureidoglycolate dehydrogenase